MLCMFATASAQAEPAQPPVRLAEVRSVQVQGGVVHSIAIDPAGQLIALGSERGHVQLVKADTGERLWMVRPSDTAALRMMFSPDGERLLVCTDRVWELTARTGEYRSLLEGLHPADCARSVDGEHVAIVGRSADGKGVFQVVAFEDWRPVLRYEFSDLAPSDVTARLDGQGWTLASGERVFDLQGDGTVELRLELEADGSYAGHCSGLGWVGSAEKATLASPAWSGRMRFGARTIVRGRGLAKSAFSQDHQRWATYSFRGGLTLWDADGEERSNHDFAVTSMCFTPDGSRLAVVTRSAQLLWVAAGEPHEGFVVSAPGNIRTLAFSRDAKFVVMTADATTVAEVETGALRVIPIGGLAVAGRGGSEFGVVREQRTDLFDARSGQHRATFASAAEAEFDDATLNAMGNHAPTPGTSFLRSGFAVSSRGLRAEVWGSFGNMGKLRLTDRAGAVVFERDEFNGGLHSVSFSPAGDRLIVSENAGSEARWRIPRLWELDIPTLELTSSEQPRAPSMTFLTDRWLIGERSSRPVQPFPRPGRSLTEIAFWDANAIGDGAVLLRGDFYKLTISPDRKRLAFEQDGRIRVFEIEVAEPR